MESRILTSDTIFSLVELKVARKGTKFLEVAGTVAAKECRRCKNMKLLKDYYRAKKSFCDTSQICKECESKKKKKYREDNRDLISEKSRIWYLSNKEKQANTKKKWRESNPDYFKNYRESNKERIKDVEKRYKIKNADKIRIRQREWHATNRGKMREYNLRYAKKNKTLMSAIYSRRRAMKAQLPNNLSSSELESILNHFDYSCALTQKKGDIHLDHVIPISVGHGGTIPGNIIPLNSKINISKGNKNIFEWFSENKKTFNMSQEKFDYLIKYLAEVNCMTIEEYKNYVYFCHENPNSIVETGTEALQ